MERLGVAPGPVVGQALEFLMELRLDEGPLGEEAAAARLRQWWDERQAENGTGAVPEVPSADATDHSS